MFNLEFDQNLIKIYNLDKPILTVAFQSTTDVVSTIFNNIYSMELSDGTVTMFNNETYIEAVITPSDSKDISFTLKVDGTIEQVEDGYKIIIDTETIFITSLDGNLLYNGESFYSSPTDSEMKIFFSLDTPFHEVKLPHTQSEESIIKIFSNEEYRYLVKAEQKTPEFSLYIYDDADRTKLRHLHRGIPVLSTVPVSDPGGSSADHYLYLDGVGNPSRPIYITAKCDVPLQVTLESAVYNATPRPIFRIIKIDSPTSEILYRGAMTYIIGSDSYQAEATVDTEWGTNELLLFQVYIDMQIETYLPISIFVGHPENTQEEVINIFSSDE